MKRKTWRSKLTKAQLRHLRLTNAYTFAEVKANVLYQKDMRFPCWECVEIGRRLGVSVELTAFNNAKE